MKPMCAVDGPEICCHSVKFCFEPPETINLFKRRIKQTQKTLLMKISGPLSNPEKTTCITDYAKNIAMSYDYFYFNKLISNQMIKPL